MTRWNILCNPNSSLKWGGEGEGEGEGGDGVKRTRSDKKWA